MIRRIEEGEFVTVGTNAELESEFRMADILEGVLRRPVASSIVQWSVSAQARREGLLLIALMILAAGMAVLAITLTKGL